MDQAQRLKDFPKCTTFIQVNRQVNEIYSHPNFNINLKKVNSK